MAGTQTTTMTFLLQTPERTADLAGKLVGIGFSATASTEPLPGFGHLLQVRDLLSPEIDDLMRAVKDHAPDAQLIGSTKSST